MFSRAQADRHQLAGYLRRICDLTSPNLPRCDEGRGRDRQNRTFPVLIAPWENGSPSVREAATALTKDICDCGMSVTLSQPVHVEEVVVGVWLPQADYREPWFFRGLARQNVPIGGGFWALGIEFVERLTILPGSETARLVAMAKQLLPPKPLETLSPTQWLATTSR